MKKLLAGLVALSSIGVGLAAADAPVGAEGVVDLSASAVSAPAVVSPPGGRAIYEVVFANEGGASVLADLTTTTVNGSFLSRGSILPLGCSAPANGTVNPTISCQTVLLAPGETRELYVAILTPPTAGTTSTTATAALSPLRVDPVVDSVPSNNADTASTPVVNDPNVAASYLEQGQSLTFKTHKVTLEESTTGAIVALSDALGGGRACGPDAICADGLRIEFPLAEGGPGSADDGPYSAANVTADLNFGKGNACRSITNAACTDKLFYVGADPAQTTPAQVAPCASPDVTVRPLPVPCVRTQTKTLAGELFIKVGLTSEDPELLPQGLTLR